MKSFRVKFYLCDSEYFTALRLVAGSVASVKDIDVDALEDFKVCVTESALILKNGGFEEVEAEFQTENGISCALSGLGGKPQKSDNELSLALIDALISDCQIGKTEKGIIEKVTLRL
jgi:hypothetical protein